MQRMEELRNSAKAEAENKADKILCMVIDKMRQYKFLIPEVTRVCLKTEKRYSSELCIELIYGPNEEVSTFKINVNPEEIRENSVWWAMSEMIPGSDLKDRESKEGGFVLTFSPEYSDDLDYKG